MKVLLLIASITFSHPVDKKKHHRRGTHYEEVPGYFDPPEQDVASHGWGADETDWNSDSSEWNTDPESESPEEEEETPLYGQSHEPEETQWEDEPTQSWPSSASSHGWPGKAQTWSIKHSPRPWHSSQKWPSSHSVPGSIKTVVKKIPVPYERPIRIENPVYTPYEKHIPIEHPVPVIKYIEKPVPKYVDHPVPVPVVKEEHVPQPYDQKVRVIVQKVFVHVPSPPQHPPKHTIIIRKKLNQRNIPTQKHKWSAFL